jgi:4,5-dihydroxyphthalate decarboxylase
MFEAGELDALFTARAPSCYMRGAPNIAHLFPDTRAAEKDYYKKTGMFPIMHLIGVKRHLVEKHPWLATSLYKAFIDAKAVAMHQVRDVNALAVTLPWLVAEAADTTRLMGEDFWRYGVEENIKEIEALARYAHEQGLVQQRLKPEDLFAKPTMDMTKI